METNQSEKTKTLLDYNIFEILGLELEEDDRLRIESMFYRSAVLQMLETSLKDTLSENVYKEIEDEVADASGTMDEFVTKLKAKLLSLNIDFENLFNPCLEAVEIEFINDQLVFLEEKAQQIENQTEKELKSSLCNTIREFIEAEEWDKVAETFKRINVEIHQV